MYQMGKPIPKLAREGKTCNTHPRAFHKRTFCQSPLTSTRIKRLGTEESGVLSRTVICVVFP